MWSALTSTTTRCPSVARRPMTRWLRRASRSGSAEFGQGSNADYTGTGTQGSHWDLRTLTHRAHVTYPAMAYAIAWYSSFGKHGKLAYVYGLSDVAHVPAAARGSARQDLAGVRALAASGPADLDLLPSLRGLGIAGDGDGCRSVPQPAVDAGGGAGHGGRCRQAGAFGELGMAAVAVECHQPRRTGSKEQDPAHPARRTVAAWQSHATSPRCRRWRGLEA